MGQYPGEGPGERPTVAAGGAAAAGGAVIMTVSDVVRQGNHVTDSAAHAVAARVSLDAARGGGGDFTSFPSAQAVFSQHQGVVGVFEQTLGLIRQDVEEFGASIVQAARTYEQTDDDALTCLQSIAAGVSGTALDQGDQRVRQQTDGLMAVTLSEAEQQQLDARPSAEPLPSATPS